MKGRKKTTDEQKRLKGTFQPCRATNAPDIKSLKSMPDAPEGLGEVAKDVYMNDGYILLMAGILNPINLRVFVYYCKLCQEFEDCDLMMEQAEDTRGKMEVARYKKTLRDQIIRMAAEFGITPVNAHKVMKQPEKEKSPLDQFING